MRHQNLSSRRGSALLLTLMVVSLLLVVVLSFVVFVRMQLRTVSNQQELLIARQNARLGLNLAIGELQKHVGPDQRVTFPATTVYPSKDVTNATGDLYTIFANTADGGSRNTYHTSSGRNAFNTQINNWWQGRHPRWFGVGNSALRRDSSDVTSSQYGEFERNQEMVWLISGNEGKLPGDAGYLTPDVAAGNPDNDDSWVWLVEEGSAVNAATSNDGLEGRVMAPRQDIPNSRGGYAFWVSDESTKANISAKDPFAGEPIGSKEYFNRLLLPQRLGWEQLPGFENLPGGNPDDPNNPLYAMFQKVTNLQQLELVDASLQDDPNNRGPLPRNFHDLTSYSLSLHTDTALGGLKKDLTVFVEDPGNTPLNNSDSMLDPNLYSPTDPRFGSNNQGFPNSLTNLPRWGKVESWYRNTGDNSNGASIVPPSPTQSGVHPVITMFKYHVGMSVDPTTGRLYLRYFPVVTMWNPYSVPLDSTTYQLELGLPLNIHALSVNYQITMTAPQTPDNKFITTTTNPWAKAELNIASDALSGHGGNSLQRFWDMKDVMRPMMATITTDFQPGEILVFSPSSDQNYNGHTGSPVQLDNHYEDLTALVLSGGAAPFGVVIPTPFELDLALSPNYSGPGIPSDIQDLRFRLVVWNNRFRSNGTMALNDGAKDNIPFSSVTPDRMADYRGYISLFTNSGDQLFRFGAATYNQENSTNAVMGNLSTKDDQYASANLGKWRKLYTDDEFVNRTPGGTRNPDEHVLGLANFSKFEGLFPSEEYYDPNQTKHAAIMHRWFATFNPGAPVWELNPEVDLPHTTYAQNSPDKFNAPSLYSLLNSEYYTRYGLNLATVDDDTGRVRGYFFTEMVRETNSQFSEITEYAIKNIRRPDAEFLSLGQLSQSNLSWMFTQPQTPFGNSEATPYTDREHIAGITSRTIAHGVTYNSSGGWDTVPNNSRNEVLDLSYVLNESLWDRYFLSTFPQSGGFDPSSDNLPNSRHLLLDNALNSINDVRDFDRAASYMMNQGALNINSTSVEAWVALFTAFRDLELESETGDINPQGTVPLVNTLLPLAEAVDFTHESSSTDPDTYGAGGDTNREITPVVAGFRYLTDEMIRSLSERIVDEVRLRGPFYSLGDFVNRRLVSPDRSGNDWDDARTGPGGNIGNPQLIGSGYDPVVGLAGLNGALQRAINLSGVNGGVNHPGHDLANDRIFNLDSNDTNLRPAIKRADTRYYHDSEHSAGAAVGENGHLFAHTPGFVSQANLLSMIGSAITPRGDTFLIRTYGDSAGSRSWIEAVVQRQPEYVDNNQEAWEDPSSLNPVNQAFGRKFTIISMKILQEDEL